MYINVVGVPMFKLYAKLKAMKKILKANNEELYGGIKQRVIQARVRLDQAQREVLSSLSKAACVREEKECLHEYISISKAEEAFLKQKSRNQWLNLGDQNNLYFHRIVRVRNSKNVIKSLMG